MDLLKKVRGVLQSLPAINVIVDINYDEQKNIIGYVCSDTFKGLSDAKSQKMIWDILKDNFGTEDLVKIEVIFHETPYERIHRISQTTNGYKPVAKFNYWLHKAPDMTRYWVFVDVTKFEDEYKAIFMVVNGVDNFKKGVTFTYTPEIIALMGIDASDIEDDLFNNAFENAESEVKIELMRKYNVQSQLGLLGRDNMFNYVYNEFQLVPKLVNDIMFNEKEIKLVDRLLSQVDNHKIKFELENKVEVSKMLARQKQTIPHNTRNSGGGAHPPIPK